MRLTSYDGIIISFALRRYSFSNYQRWVACLHLVTPSTGNSSFHCRSLPRVSSAFQFCSSCHLPTSLCGTRFVLSVQNYFVWLSLCKFYWFVWQVSAGLVFSLCRSIRLAVHAWRDFLLSAWILELRSCVGNSSQFWLVLLWLLLLLETETDGEA
jgi:hypothetical protein